MHPREGAQPSAWRSSRRSTTSVTCRTTRSSSIVATSSAPIRCSNRARTDARRPTATARFTGDVNNMPSTVGGAGYHADGKLPRYREIDFRLASELGPVDGADVADWPVDYDEMEPYYAEAERSIGVAGDHTANPFAAWRADPYPMPPGADMFLTTLTAPAAERLGYHPYRAPTGVNSVPYDGRPACNNCGFCAFYGCPIEAKGDPVALLRRALRTGNCEIRPESVALEVLVDGTGKKSRGVRYLDADGVQHEVSSDAVVVACGAFETPRLLLRSGIGNSSDLVGRYLMFHLQTLVLGLLPDPAPCVQGSRRHASHGRSDHRRRRECGGGEGGRRAVHARRHRRTRWQWPRDHRGAVHGARPRAQRAHGAVGPSRPDGRLHDAGRGSAAAHQPRRPRPRRTRRVGSAGRTDHLHVASGRRRVRAALGPAARGGAHRGGRALHRTG